MTHRKSRNLFTSFMLLTLLLEASLCRAGQKEVLDQTVHLNDSLLGSLEDLLSDDLDLSSALSENNTSMQSMSITELEETNANAEVLRTQISDYFSGICSKYFAKNPLDDKQMVVIKNEGCQVLFKNVNEGMENLLHAKRTSSAAVYGLIKLSKKLRKEKSGKKKNDKKAPRTITTIKKYNETMMSLVHKKVSKCQFSLDGDDCQHKKGSHEEFYREHVFPDVQKDEQKDIDFQESLNSQPTEDLNLRSLSQLTEMGSDFESCKPQLEKDNQTKEQLLSFSEKSIQNQGWRGVIHQFSYKLPYKRGNNLPTLEFQKVIHGFPNGIYEEKDVRAKMENYKKTYDWTKYMSLDEVFKKESDWNRQQIDHQIIYKACFRSNLAIVLQYCNEAQLNYINYYLLNNRIQNQKDKKCLITQEKMKTNPVIFFTRAQDDQFYAQVHFARAMHSLEWIKKVLQERLEKKSSSSALKDKVKRLVTQIKQSGYKNKELQVQLLNVAIKNEASLKPVTKKVQLDLKNALKKCQDAHDGKKCSTLQELNHPHGEMVSGVGLSCGFGTEPVWSSTSYRCEIKQISKDLFQKVLPNNLEPKGQYILPLDMLNTLLYAKKLISELDQSVIDQISPSVFSEEGFLFKNDIPQEDLIKDVFQRFLVVFYELERLVLKKLVKSTPQLEERFYVMRGQLLKLPQIIRTQKVVIEVLKNYNCRTQIVSKDRLNSYMSNTENEYDAAFNSYMGDDCAFQIKRNNGHCDPFKYWLKDDLYTGLWHSSYFWRPECAKTD